MNNKLKGWKKVILTVSTLILFFWFYIHHYDVLFDSKSNITFKAINDENSQPIEHGEIIISRIEKPWYSMWGTYEVFHGNTNRLGEFSFEVSESKRYRVKVSKEFKKRFINDKNKYFGSVEFEGENVADEDTLIIKCDR